MALRKGICPNCNHEFTQKYSGRGRPRKYCKGCRPDKKKKRAETLSAYVNSFDWGDLPRPWRFTRPGNPTRWIGPHRLVLYTTLERFSFSIQLMGHWHGRNSAIPVETDNRERAMEWAERQARVLVDSFDYT